jgi:8-oxo-dGTP pyrophosphatase MutT (NUDIX family)
LIDPRALAQLVAAFHDDDSAAKKSRDLTLHLLEHTPAPFSRSQFIPGHITTTGFVLNPPNDSVLLIHHRRLDRWLLPGGHVEPEDETIYASARREVIEETGAQLIDDPEPPLVGIDVHAIPPGKREPLHYHHDLVFLFRAASADLARDSSEVREAKWFPIADLLRPDFPLPDNIKLVLHHRLKPVPNG